MGGSVKVLTGVVCFKLPYFMGYEYHLRNIGLRFNTKKSFKHGKDCNGAVKSFQQQIAHACLILILSRKRRNDKFYTFLEGVR